MIVKTDSDSYEVEHLAIEKSLEIKVGEATLYNISGKLPNGDRIILTPDLTEDEAKFYFAKFKGCEKYGIPVWYSRTLSERLKEVLSNASKN